MKTGPLFDLDLRGVFAVPPLARNADRSLNLAGNDRLLRHMSAGGLRRFLYGGNAFLYHITLADYAQLLEWMAAQPSDHWMIPSAGPSFGRALDQAPLLRKHAFPAVMLLPCADPRDAAGLERGLREFADAAETKLIVYLKEESNFGSDKEAGLDVVGRLVADGICAWIKYAVVRAEPTTDAYLTSLLTRVDRKKVISGMGERPAIVHLRDWKLPAFTTGSGCLAPALTNALLEACTAGHFQTAADLREKFLPLEDLRDAWNPARVLHHATELAGIADTGPITPFLSPLSASQLKQLEPIARALAEAQLKPA